MSGGGSPKNEVKKIQIMDNCSSDPSFKSRFYCEAGWHLEKQSKHCVLIYNLASKVTAKKKPKLFEPAAVTVASHYRISKDTARRAMRKLHKLGFFELVGTTRYGTNCYRFVSHDEWARKHPGQCAVYQPHSEIEQMHAGLETVLSEEHKVHAKSEPISGRQSTEAEEQGAQKGAVDKQGEGSQHLSYGTREHSAKPKGLGDTTSASAAQPEETMLARELAHLSRGEITFGDKQRVRLAELLKEFTAKEIMSAFKSWLKEQDLSDPKNVSFLPSTFVQIADSLAYSARRKKQEDEAYHKLVDATRERLQAEAEAESQELERKRKEEENAFNPLFGVESCLAD
jgi:hypothetical protein